MEGTFFCKVVSKRATPEGGKLACASLEEGATPCPHRLSLIVLGVQGKCQKIQDGAEGLTGSASDIESSGLHTLQVRDLV